MGKRRADDSKGGGGQGAVQLGAPPSRHPSAQQPQAARTYAVIAHGPGHARGAQNDRHTPSPAGPLPATRLFAAVMRRQGLTSNPVKMFFAVSLVRFGHLVMRSRAMACRRASEAARRREATDQAATRQPRKSEFENQRVIFIRSTCQHGHRNKYPTSLRAWRLICRRGKLRGTEAQQARQAEQAPAPCKAGTKPMSAGCGRLLPEPRQASPTAGPCPHTFLMDVGEPKPSCRAASSSRMLKTP